MEQKMSYVTNIHPGGFKGKKQTNRAKVELYKNLPWEGWWEKVFVILCIEKSDSTTMTQGETPDTSLFFFPYTANGSKFRAKQI